MKEKKITLTKQEDSIEFFERLIVEIDDELKHPSSLSWKKKPSLENLLRASIIESTICRICREQNSIACSAITVRLPNVQSGQATLTVANELRRFLNPKAYIESCISKRLQ